MSTPTKAFASQADLEEKKVSFTKLSDHAYAYTAEGDPNTGIVIGDDAVMVIDTQATPVMAQDVIRRIREVTDKPIKYVTLSHYHAVRVLGASAYQPEHIIASQDTYDLIVERGEFDKASEIGRFPRLFQNVESVPEGLTWPTITFTGKMTLWLGKLEVQILQLGRGHTKGDTVVWLPQEKILFSGDLVEFDATPYAGDAYFKDWPHRRWTTSPPCNPKSWCLAVAPRCKRPSRCKPAWQAHASSSAMCMPACRPVPPQARTCARSMKKPLPSCSPSTATGSSSTTACPLT